MRAARLLLLAGACVAFGIVLVAPRRSDATPLYAAREGRACDNCHLTPNTWENPRLAERKCTLSCGSCHVDPAGGGIRNASGRFFGRATLPMIATSPRPTQDWDRELLDAISRKDRATTYSDSLPLGPDTYAESRAWPSPPFDRWALGSPLGGASRYALWPGRYGAINPDPLLRVGWDIRLGTLFSQSVLAFPMEADLEAALHPIEHVSAVASVGARGRTRGLSATTDDPSTPYLRHGIVLLHEAPFGAYAKAGRFVPAFGLRLDDHTVQNRLAFEVDESLPESRVTGVEVGVNPNYPFVSVAWFRNAAGRNPPDDFDPFASLAGSGVAVNAAFREMGWSVGTSVLTRRREVTDGGDATSVALFGVLNPWRWRRTLPIAYQVEIDYGERTRDSGRTAKQAAFYQEIDYQLANGVNLLLAQDWLDPDREVKDDDAYRVSGGFQVTPIPGATFDLRGRALVPAGDSGGADVFFQLHLWN